MYEVISDVLEKNLKGLDKYNHENVNNLNRNICEEVKKRLKDDTTIKRYKILVHCIIGNALLIC